MMTELVKSDAVQALLDKVAGMPEPGGDDRFKAILRDMTEAMMIVIERHDVSDGELWTFVDYLQKAAPEFGLIVPGIGIEHFMDLKADRDEAEQHADAQTTPRTIEGPLFVEGAPQSDYVAKLNAAGESGEPLTIEGTIRDVDGAAIDGAVLDVWHADLSGLYSHFDSSQPAFNNRAKIIPSADGGYKIETIMPVGYSVPPGGSTEQLLGAVGRHGDRPAHVHLLVRAPGYAPLTTQINIADDPKVHDDFAFGTRDGLVPSIDRLGNHAHITFDLILRKAEDDAESSLSVRPRAAA
ncbi:MAG: dioxygenase [Pseudomonadota bacterium]